VLNKGPETLDLTFCFHTYLKVPDVEKCALYNFRGDSQEANPTTCKIILHVHRYLQIIFLLKDLLKTLADFPRENIMINTAFADSENCSTGLTYTDKTKEGMPEVVEKNDPIQLTDFTDRVRFS
jgi:hypothetical protein